MRCAYFRAPQGRSPQPPHNEVRARSPARERPLSSARYASPSAAHLRTQAVGTFPGRRLPAGLTEADPTFRGPESASGRSRRRPGQRPGTRLRVSGPNQPVSEPLATAAGGVPRAPPPTSQPRLPAAWRGGLTGSGGSLTVRPPASPRGHLILGRRGEAPRGPASGLLTGRPNTSQEAEQRAGRPGAGM